MGDFYVVCEVYENWVGLSGIIVLFEGCIKILVECWIVEVVYDVELIERCMIVIDVEWFVWFGIIDVVCKCF